MGQKWKLMLGLNCNKKNIEEVGVQRKKVGAFSPLNYTVCSMNRDYIQKLTSKSKRLGPFMNMDYKLL